METILNSNTTWGAEADKLITNFTGIISNVKHYGALGDGETDDTVAFEAAIAAVSANGGAIYIPDGVFLIQLSLAKDKVAFVGSGYGSILKNISTAGATDFVITSTGDYTVIRNLKIIGGIKLNDTDYSKIQDCEIDATGINYGIWCSGNWLELSRNVVRNAVLANIREEQTNNSAFRLIGNTIGNSLANGVEMAWTGTPGTGDTLIGQVITGNTFAENAHYGLAINGTHDNLIAGNFYERNKYGGVFCQRIIETVITGNYFEYNKIATYETAPGDGYCGAIVLLLDDCTEVGGLIGSVLVTDNEFQGELRSVVITGSAAVSHVVKASDNLFLACSGIRVTNYLANYILQLNDNIGISYVGLATTPIYVFAESEVSGSKIQISGNYAETVHTGVSLGYITSVVVDNNKFVGCTARGVYAGASSVTLKDNVFTDNAAAVVADTGGSYTAIGNIGLADN